MKALKDVLIDYDIALLEALAQKRGLSFPPGRAAAELAAFVEELLAPLSLTIALDDLSSEETKALQSLVQAGGLLEAPKFSRQFGDIRAMGTARLQREKPWQSPANAAEGLWYRALIAKGFRHTLAGPEEMVFIPDDVLQALPDLSPMPQASPRFQMGLAPAPKITLPANKRAEEDFFTLLHYIQSHIIRLQAEGDLPPDHITALKAAFYPIEVQANPRAQNQAQYWFAFIYHLAQRAGFLTQQGQQLKLLPHKTRNWLQESESNRLRFLQTSWRSDPTWNDLWHTPGLVPKATGWDNSPLLGRAKILEYLAQLPSQEWHSIDTFIQTLKKLDPDFQRPQGDYQSWYIYDEGGQALMGFEHWDVVEGALIRHLLVDVLPALGVLDLGLPGEGLAPISFRISDPHFLKPDQRDEPPALPQATRIRINPNDFVVRVPKAASLYDRFQLARFAHFLRREVDHSVYQISQSSYRQAQTQSITLEQILAFLNRVTKQQVPLALSDALQRWDKQIGAVKLETLTLLRVNHPDMVDELLQHPKIGPLLDRPFGKQSLIVPQENLAQLKGLLVAEGYLDS